MISFINLGSLALQTAINTFGTNHIYDEGNYHDKPHNRFRHDNTHVADGGRQHIRDTLLLTFAWCTVVLLAAYTASPTLVRLITCVETRFGSGITAAVRNAKKRHKYRR